MIDERRAGRALPRAEQHLPRPVAADQRAVQAAGGGLQERRCVGALFRAATNVCHRGRAGHSPAFGFSFPEKLPLADLFKYIDIHHEVRGSLRC
jgi:hypothetical protein